MIELSGRDLIKPKALDVEKETLTKSYGKFVAKPLERGFGLTLGNALRRVMLSSLDGASVSAVRVEGVLHEFTPIPDVKEDVAEIILNLKEIRFRLDEDEVMGAVDMTGPCIVKASDITGNIRVLNPDQIVAHVGPQGVFRCELRITKGRGYVAAENQPMEGMPIGWIPVDSFCSPVKRVNYTVTQSRVGQRTDFDKLILEVWTDGAVQPEEAVSLGSKILKDQLSVFLKFEDQPEPMLMSRGEDGKTQFNPNLYRSVEELELSVRSANCLQNAAIKYIHELVQKTENEMLKTKNFGRKSLNEIKEILVEMGLGLGMRLDGFQVPEGHMSAEAGASHEHADSHELDEGVHDSLSDEE